MRFKENEEVVSKPGPGQYLEKVAMTTKKKPAFQMDIADRKLLTNEKTMSPGPLSYDIVSGMSMCASTNQLNLLQMVSSVDSLQ